MLVYTLCYFCLILSYKFIKYVNTNKNFAFLTSLSKNNIIKLVMNDFYDIIVSHNYEMIKTKNYVINYTKNEK